MKKFTLAALLMLPLTVPATAQTFHSRGGGAAALFHSPTAARVAAPGDRLQQSVFQHSRNGAWRDTTRTTYPRYDAAGHALERIIEDRLTSGWQVRNRVTFTYNAQNQLIHDTLFSYLGNPLFATRRTYNAAGKLDSMISRVRFLGQWEDSRRDVNSYDANGFLIRQLQQDNRNGAWVNWAQILYTTDAQGRVILDEFQYSNQTGGWDPSDRIAYTYTASDSIATVTGSDYNPTTGAFEVAGRGRLRYSVVGTLDSIYNEPYDATTGTYSLGLLATYTYDARQNRLSETIKMGASLATLVDLSRTVFTYTITGLTDDLLSAAPLTLAPNPTASGRAELRYELEASTTVTIEIFDLLGKRIATPQPPTAQAAGAYTLSLDARDLRAGLYVVRLTAGGGRRQVKLVVQ